MGWNKWRYTSLLANIKLFLADVLVMLEVPKISQKNVTESKENIEVNTSDEHNKSLDEFSFIED